MLSHHGSDLAPNRTSWTLNARTKNSTLKKPRLEASRESQREPTEDRKIRTRFFCSNGNVETAQAQVASEEGKAESERSHKGKQKMLLNLNHKLSSDPISLLVHDTHKKSHCNIHRPIWCFNQSQSIIIVAFRKRGNPERVMIADVMLIDVMCEENGAYHAISTGCICTILP
ncbi:hypothetical protein PNOK_0034500 [Pyrrhoderma noxium]|uniref:Uncharacterized protein n=1 Tax=Pyrrhoderma noxium TaxID=2282107 RepID=A0A286UUM1_9AGAM|nr:hypothetical protein PNOK_0034500 [Pyrrhoderma noxium]